MTHRPAMIASLIRSLVATETLKIPPPVAMAVSVTEVEVSSDLSHATIYIGALQNAPAAVKFLNKKKGALKHQIALELKIFKIPQLRFVIDERGERASRIDMLLDGKDPDKELLNG